MNERIRELTEQCMVEVKNVPVTGTDGWTALETVRQIDPEKFAELIVRECMNVAYLCSHADCYNGDEFIHAGDKIKEHFGVE